MNLSRKFVLTEIRNAVVDSGIKIRDDDMTKSGQYRFDWIILDHYALRICSLRRGGYGAILEARQTFEEERNVYRMHEGKAKKPPTLTAEQAQNIIDAHEIDMIFDNVEEYDMLKLNNPELLQAYEVLKEIASS